MTYNSLHAGVQPVESEGLVHAHELVLGPGVIPINDHRLLCSLSFTQNFTVQQPVAVRGNSRPSNDAALLEGLFVYSMTALHIMLHMSPVIRKKSIQQPESGLVGVGTV